MPVSYLEQTEWYHSNVHITYPVVSAWKMLYEANSHSREGQWECHLNHSNSYKQYYGRRTQPFLLFGLPPIRSRVSNTFRVHSLPYQPQRPGQVTTPHKLFSLGHSNIPNNLTHLYSRQGILNFGYIASASQAVEVRC